MATARYDKKYEGWILEYTDHTKIAQGKRGDSKKKQKDRTYPTLSKRQQKQKEAQMLNLALELEAKSKRGIVNKDNVDKPISAIEYLSNMQVVTKTSDAEGIAARKREISKFVEFLSLRYKKCYLHEINKDVATAYLKTLSYLSHGTLNKRRAGLAAVFARIQEDMEEWGSPYRYRNPFRKQSILDGIKQDEEGKVRYAERRKFEIEQVKEIIERATEEHPLLGAVWYFGFLTGWRLGDILNLKWSQIDLKKRTIDIVFGKTRVASKGKLKAKIYITDVMKEVIEVLGRYSADENLLPKNWRGDGGVDAIYKKNRRILGLMGLGEYVNAGAKKQYPYTFHGLRGTVTTLLKLKDFNRDRIDFLVGHRGKGVDAEHYDRFYETPKESTADMIGYLESLLK